MDGVLIGVVKDARVQGTDEPFQIYYTDGRGDWTWDLDNIVA
jgi:hypothetical protein